MECETKKQLTLLMLNDFKSKIQIEHTTFFVPLHNETIFL